MICATVAPCARYLGNKVPSADHSVHGERAALGGVQKSLLHSPKFRQPHLQVGLFVFPGVTTRNALGGADMTKSPFRTPRARSAGIGPPLRVGIWLKPSPPRLPPSVEDLAVHLPKARKRAPEQTPRSPRDIGHTLRKLPGQSPVNPRQTGGKLYVH